MQVFKNEHDTKRVIFNIDSRLAHRLEKAKNKAKRFSRKLNVDAIIDEALAHFLTEAEQQLEQLSQTQKESTGDPIVMEATLVPEEMAETTELQVRKPSMPQVK